MANYYISSSAYEAITPWGGQQNMLLQSNTFNNAAWTATNATVTQSGTDADPFGGTTAWRLTDNSTNGVHGIFQTITKAAANKRYLFSFYAFTGPIRKTVRIAIGDTGATTPTNSRFVTLNLANGGYTESGENLTGTGFTFGGQRIEPVPGFAGWYRCMLSAVSNTATTLTVSMSLDIGTVPNTSPSYIGASNYILICKAQLVPSIYVNGTYVETTTAAIGQTGSFTATVGQITRPTDPGGDGIAFSATVGFGAERCFRCTTGGTVGASEPSAVGGNPWSNKNGTTTADNVAVWTEVSGNETYQTPGAWAPYMRALGPLNINGVLGPYFSLNIISSIPAGGTGYVVGDIIAVSGLSASVTLDFPILRVSSVSAGAVTGVTILNHGLWNTGSGTVATTKITGAGSGATVSILTLVNGNTPFVAGDTVYFGHTHCEWMNNQSNTTLGTPSRPDVSGGLLGSPNIFVSVNQGASGHIPPTSADYLPGAKMAGGNNIGWQIVGSLEIYGMTFLMPLAQNLNIGGFGQKYIDCTFVDVWTTGAPFPGGGASGQTIWENCAVKVIQNIGTAAPVPVASSFIWRNSPNAISYAGSVSTGGLITIGQAVSNPYILLEGVDLSPMGSNRIINYTTVGFGPIQLLRCKLASNAVIDNIAGTSPYVYAPTVDVVQCDSGSLTLRNERRWSAGLLVTDTAVTRTGGATDVGTAIAWKIIPSIHGNRQYPFETMRMSIYNSVTGSSRNISIYGVCNQPTPDTGMLWPDINFLGTAGSTLASFASQMPATRLSTPAALTADTSAWDANVTARANTTVYAVGAVIKVASNPGRIFICTTGGTSAGSEPGGYASAVDGGSVTDNTAVFIAGYRFKQTITMTPQNAGLIHAIVKVAKPLATAIFWVDPQIVLS